MGGSFRHGGGGAPSTRPTGRPRFHRPLRPIPPKMLLRPACGSGGSRPPRAGLATRSTKTDAERVAQHTLTDSAAGIEPDDLRDWFDSLEDILFRYGAEEAATLLAKLEAYARQRGVQPPFNAITDNANTIPPEDQPDY